MKTLTVIASRESKPNIEIKYAINGNYGIELISDKEETVLFPEAIKLEIWVSHMFPGTHQEWNAYIMDCVIDKLKDEGLTYTTVYGTFIK